MWAATGLPWPAGVGRASTGVAAGRSTRWAGPLEDWLSAYDAALRTSTRTTLHASAARSTLALHWRARRRWWSCRTRRWRWSLINRPRASLRRDHSTLRNNGLLRDWLGGRRCRRSRNWSSSGHRSRRSQRRFWLHGRLRDRNRRWWVLGRRDNHSRWRGCLLNNRRSRLAGWRRNDNSLFRLCRSFHYRRRFRDHHRRFFLHRGRCRRNRDLGPGWRGNGGRRSCGHCRARWNWRMLLLHFFFFQQLEHIAGFRDLGQIKLRLDLAGSGLLPGNDRARFVRKIPSYLLSLVSLD